ncbi:MAG: hypothetical protein WBP58_06385 [Chitinophagaceae bacterium]
MHKMKNRVFWVALMIGLFPGCKKESSEADSPIAFPMAAGVLEEASGIADSRLNAGMLWVQEDSGNPPELSLLSHEGQLVKTIPVKGALNTDWEDLALAAGPDPALRYLYIADIGDNDQKRDRINILRAPETAASASEIMVETFPVKYEDGAHDAEAIIVEPGSLDIYIITKRDARSGVYVVKYPYSTTTVNIATKAWELPYNGVVSAAIQNDGAAVAVKDYLSIRLYTRLPGEKISAVLAKPFTSLPYQIEQQGEAICFTNDGKYYFTLSEKQSSAVSLMRYMR